MLLAQISQPLRWSNEDSADGVTTRWPRLHPPWTTWALWSIIWSPSPLTTHQVAMKGWSFPHLNRRSETRATRSPQIAAHSCLCNEAWQLERPRFWYDKWAPRYWSSHRSVSSWLQPNFALMMFLPQDGYYWEVKAWIYVTRWTKQ